MCVERVDSPEAPEDGRHQEVKIPGGQIPLLAMQLESSQSSSTIDIGTVGDIRKRMLDTTENGRYLL